MGPLSRTGSLLAMVAKKRNPNTRKREMEFKEFKNLFQAHTGRVFDRNEFLFITDTDKDKLWETYLESFPEGTNEIFRERREYDCSCCRHFIKSVGNVVAIENNKITTIWDFKVKDKKYQAVIDALSAYVKSIPIRDVFVTRELSVGTKRNHEQFEDGTVFTWEHFQIDIPKKFITRSDKTIPSLVGEKRDIRNVFKRSLEEISEDAIETVLDLINQNSLYKGDEWKGALAKFFDIHKKYHKLSEAKQDVFCWQKSVEVGGAIGKIRNHSIGVLLNDISQGVDLNEAVKRYEAIVAPTNYKRPKAIFTKKMVQQAQDKLTEMGLVDSLGRRFATIDDITVNNILFANRDSAKRMGEDVFSELQQEATISPKKFDKVEEIPIEQFVSDVIPTATNIEVFLKNNHASNFVSLVAPKVKDCKSLFKWDNNFSWAYGGNITDSMKERVKAAGGKVDGIIRFSLQWNENHDNRNDFDAHCKEPNGNHIWYGNEGHRHPSSGMLDVDIIHPGPKEVAVENITWSNLDKMQEGVYTFWVNNYSHRGGRSGFSAEIEYNGQIYSYEYAKDIRHSANVIVAKLKFSKKDGITFIESLPSTEASRIIWDLPTNQFHPVSICMFSPNYWDGQKGVGHKHYFFILSGCKNEDQPNGFFNEFLKEDLTEHKRVFEALGSKMRVAESVEQLSGLGFSSTKRNSLICKVEGSFTRVVKVVF